MSEQNNIDECFQSLYTNSSSITKMTRVLQDDLKLLYKIFRQNDKSLKIKKKRPQLKMNLSKELEEFLLIENGSKLTKAEVMKSVSNYIKEQNLQIQEDKRRFLPNKELSKIFGIKKPQNMTFVEINKHVSPHLTQ